MRKKLVSRMNDKLDFAKGMITKPKTVGAIAPTGIRMARKMASAIRPDSGLPVLELGPGTGAITKAILETGIRPEMLISIEYTERFLGGLRHRYPGVQFIHGDAFDLASISKELGIEKFDCVISGLPLLNFPMKQRIKLVNSALEFIDPGRPMVQFSYGLKPSVPAQPKQFNVDHIDTVIRNIPPARIWAYTQAES